MGVMWGDGGGGREGEWRGVGCGGGCWCVCGAYGVEVMLDAMIVMMQGSMSAEDRAAVLACMSGGDRMAALVWGGSGGVDGGVAMGDDGW